MTVCNDGFGVLIAEEGLLPLRLGTQGSKACFVDGEGLIVPITKEPDNAISFTLEFTDSGDEWLLHMGREDGPHDLRWLPCAGG